MIETDIKISRSFIKFSCICVMSQVSEDRLKTQVYAFLSTNNLDMTSATLQLPRILSSDPLHSNVLDTKL